MYRSWLLLGFGIGFRLEGGDRLADDLQDRLAVLVAQLVIRGKRLRISAGMSAAAFLRASSASRILSIGTLSRTPPVNATRMTICSGHGRRFELRLDEDGPDSLAMVDDLASVVIKPRAELGEGFQLSELRIRELEIARHGPVGRRLSLATDAGNGLADIDGGKDAQLE